LVVSFRHRYPRLDQPAFADNQCRIKSRQFVDLALDDGLAARLVWVRCHRGTPDRQGSAAAISGEVEHIVAIVEAVPIDFTRRQYDDAADVPTLYASVDDLGRDWIWLCDDEHGEGPWLRLPEPDFA
jgi:hypothetical protein